MVGGDQGIEWLSLSSLFTVWLCSWFFIMDFCEVGWYKPVSTISVILRPLSGIPRWLSGKEAAYQCRRYGFDPWTGKTPCRREWQPTPVFLPAESHEQRSLAGYSPWCHKKSDTTEWLTLSTNKKEERKERGILKIYLVCEVRGLALKWVKLSRLS